MDSASQAIIARFFDSSMNCLGPFEIDTRDPGAILWDLILTDLTNDRGVHLKTDDIIESMKYSAWDSSEFVNLSVMYLSSAVEDVDHSKVCASHSYNLYRSVSSYNEFKRVNVLANAYEIAMSKVEIGGTVVLSVSLLDSRNIAECFQNYRTFSHVLSIVISVSGVYMYQSYPKHAATNQGYTLLEYMSQPSVYTPIKSHGKGREFVAGVTSLLKLSVDQNNCWSKAMNLLYSTLFHVDLIRLGSMQIGSTFAPFLSVGMHVTTAEYIHGTFLKLLPICTIPPATIVFSAQFAASMKFAYAYDFTNHNSLTGFCFENTGESRAKFPRFIDYPSSLSAGYIDPLNMSCAYCKYSSSVRIHSCSKCGVVFYCCYEHQRKNSKIHRIFCLPILGQSIDVYVHEEKAIR